MYYFKRTYSSYIDMPFKILENYYKQHAYIKITTDEKIMRYQIFSVFVETKDWSYMNFNFKNDEEWLSHLERLKNNSLYDTYIDIKGDDQILILQTCSEKSEYKKYKQKFLLIIAERID